MRFPAIGLLCLMIVVPVALSGCATPSIPSDQLHNFALLVPEDIYGNGSAVTEVDSGLKRSQLLWTAEGPGILPGVNTRRGVNVLPGKHSIQVYTCHASDTRSCGPDVYVFDAKPGLAYVLRGPGHNVEVLDRLQKSSMGYLHPIADREFVSDQEFSNLQLTAQTNAANAAFAITEQRRRDQISIRKMGAQVCQEFGHGMIYVGYVERITDDKVQIRIADAHMKGDPTIRPGGFVPSIIWDSPMQWDLCR
ncbi:hypothetical protein [Pseudomonas sp.]|uniref:hypothetical protein n=1 Tax=Pseudomonas sp. TaxID=306 RepID=UPI00261ACA2F|nr:hypothetical protein [Pseudomonas sp.]